MGVFEMDNFKKGTDAIAKAMAEAGCNYNRWWRR